MAPIGNHGWETGCGSLFGALSIDFLVIIALKYFIAEP